LFDLISDETGDADYYPPLPPVQDWSYLHQLDKEKEVLGFYMSGHPLFEYRSLIKNLTNANSQTGKSRSHEDLMLAGIVSSISKKKDNKGNPIAFVEFEDLSGKFEVPLFNRDYQQHFSTLLPGKVYFIIGSKSTFNGNDDGILRVMPQAIVPFEDLPTVLKGELKILLNFEQIKKGFLNEIGKWTKAHPGGFKLQTQVQSEDLNSYLLESRKLIFPNNEVLGWLEKERIDFQLRITTNAKNA
jgi:DNA polymerase-3 subunit alpha